MTIRTKEEFHIVTSRNTISKVYEGPKAQELAEAALRDIGHPGWRILKVITNYEDVTPETQEA
jgi:hypothetical protein